MSIPNQKRIKEENSLAFNTCLSPKAGVTVSQLAHYEPLPPLSEPYLALLKDFKDNQKI